MVKISRNPKQFTSLKTSTLVGANILERYDLQEYIWNSAETFCQELKQRLLIIGKEVEPSKIVRDHIDLLAIDGGGATVILELKRGNDKLQLFQAISYAGMVAGLTRDELLGCKGIDGVRAHDLDNFVNAEESAEADDVVNRDQRIILIAEEFDYEVLVGARWLRDKYEVEIACVRVSMAIDPATSGEYLTFTQIFPPPEIEEVARRRGQIRLNGTDSQWKGWGKLPLNELLGMADDRQVRPLVDICRRLSEIWDEWPTERGALMYSKTTSIGWRSLFKVFVSSERWNTPARQLDVSVVSKNVAALTGQDLAVIRSTLKEHHPQQAAHLNDSVIRLSTPSQAEALITQLKEWWDLRPQSHGLNLERADAPIQKAESDSAR